MDTISSILHSVQGKSLSKQERGELAIALAKALLNASQKHLTRRDKKRYKMFHRMMQDTRGKAFMTAMVDSSFRTQNPAKIVSRLQYLLKQYGTPSFLTLPQKGLFFLFRIGGQLFPGFAASILQKLLRRETAEVILPGEEIALLEHLEKRKKEGYEVNLNRLGEAILGEEEAQKRLQLYLEDLKRPEIRVISIKISSIFSQINPLAFDENLKTLKERLRELFYACLPEKKLINLDMEESTDLQLTVALFQELLEEPEFHGLTQGIALQSYLPESLQVLRRLLLWAEKRVRNGGAPIRIRIVKGANLGMERVEASIRGWPQNPYSSKLESDASFKEMIELGIKRSTFAHIGVASHNIFDIAYALLLRAEHQAEERVEFEMLEGMATHLTKTIFDVSHKLLLYCPAAKKEDFHTAMAYLMRRFDEQTSKENFLPYLFTLRAGTSTWDTQAAEFLSSLMLQPSHAALRTQTREKVQPLLGKGFQNEPDTDLSLSHNRVWARKLLEKWKSGSHHVACQIANQEHRTKAMGFGMDPSDPTHPLYSYSLASKEDIQRAIDFAKEQKPLKLYERQERFHQLAYLIRENRGSLIHAMMAESGKIFQEADAEVSEAIDMAEYYSRSMPHLVDTVPRIAAVASPWNFPLAIPAGACLQAMGAGYNVLFKPAPEAVLVGSLLFELMQAANLPIQFLPMQDRVEGSFLIRHPLVNTVLLTGSTATARYFLKVRPRLRLFAETGGKNSMIVTSLADRDLAIKDIVQSSFGYAGQKCSALSLLICEEEVYHDTTFMNQLRDAAMSLPVGSQWSPETKVTPLIRAPSPHLQRAIATLDPGEEWLLEPVRDKTNPFLYSPGIKLGVQSGSFMHQTELFGPILGVMCAKNLEEAIQFANATPYGLTAGLHSLDEREHALWEEKIQAGNLYINRGITGAIVGRQPFGGTKASSFGIGMKGGGPHSILQLLPYSTEESAYTLWWKEYFSKSSSLSTLIGQENRLFFRAHSEIFLFLQGDEKADDIALLLKAAALSSTTFIAYNPGHISLPNHRELPLQEFMKAIHKKEGARIRCLQKPPESLAAIWGETAACIDVARPSPHGGFEFLHFVREVALSYNFHRYGSINLPVANK